MQNMERRPVRTGINKNQNIDMLKEAIILMQSQISKTADELTKTKLEERLLELKSKLIKEEGIKKDDSLDEYFPVLDDHIIKNEQYEIESIKQGLENEKIILESENPIITLYFEKKSKLTSIKEHISFLQNEIEENVDNSEYDFNEKIAELRKHEKDAEEIENFLNQELQKPGMKEDVEYLEEIYAKLNIVDERFKGFNKLSESEQSKRNYKDTNTSLS